MRANEFINEGLWSAAKDWAAQKGFLGATKQRAALTRQIGAEEEAESIARNEQLLSNTLLKAEQAGMLKAGKSGTGKAVSDFLNVWVKSLLKNYNISPDQQNQLNVLYKSFEQNYRGGGELPPQGNQIFSAIETVKTMQDDSQTPPAPATTQAAPAPTQQPTPSQAAAPSPTQQPAPAPAQAPGASAFSQMAQQLGQQSQTGAKRTGGKVAGQLSQTPNAVRKREKRATASASNTSGSKAFGQMAQQLSQQTPGAKKQSPGAQVFGQMAQQLRQPQAKKVTSKKTTAKPGTSAFGQMAGQLGA